MAELVPDNSKKYRQFIWTSALNLVFLVILALYIRSLIQSGISTLPTGASAAATLPEITYVIALPVFSAVGLLLAIAWKPLSRGIIVLLALHYILTMSIVLLVGYADITFLLSQIRSGLPGAFISFFILAALVFLFIFNLKSLNDLDLPSIFGKR